MRNIGYRLSAVLFAATPLLAAAAPAEGTPPGRQLAGTLLVLLLVLCSQVGLLSLCLVYSLVHPAAVRNGGRLPAKGPVKNFLAGLLFVVAVVFFIAFCGQLPSGLGGLLMLAAGLILMYLLVMGLSMSCHALGDRWKADAGDDGSGSVLSRVLRGGVLILGAGLLPVAGAFFVVVVLIGSLGVALRYRHASRRKGTGEPSSDASAGVV